MAIKKLLKNASLTIILSITAFCSFIQPVFADNNYAATMDANGVESIEKIPEAIDEDEESEMDSEYEKN